MHMHMNFWWGTDIGDFFIKGFTINGTGQMVSLCISLFVLSVALEGLKVSIALSKIYVLLKVIFFVTCELMESDEMFM